MGCFVEHGVEYSQVFEYSTILDTEQFESCFSNESQP